MSRGVAPDPLVAGALGRLVVPEHEPEFWTRLVGALEAGPVAPPARAGRDPRRVVVDPAALGNAGVPGAAAALVGPAALANPSPLVAPGGTVAQGAAGAPPVPVGAAPVEDGDAARSEVVDLRRARRRRRANGAMAVGAVAAVVVVVMATTTLLRSPTARQAVDLASSTTGVPPGDDGEASPTGSTSADTTAIQTASATTPPASASASATVGAWLDAVAGADSTTAWDLLAPRSRDALDDGTGPEAGAALLRAQFGHWAGVEPQMLLETALATGSDRAVALVTMVADLPGDGTSVPQVLTLPVRVRGAEAEVDPAAVGGEGIVLVDPSGTSGRLPRLRRSDPVTVAFPAGCDEPALRFDAGPVHLVGSDPVIATAEAADGGLQATYQLDQAERGDHLLTAACHAPDGSILALTSLLEVA